MQSQNKDITYASCTACHEVVARQGARMLLTCGCPTTPATIKV